MKNFFLAHLRWQVLLSVLLAIAVVGVAIAFRASEARSEWQTLRDQHLAWAVSPLKSTCDELWEKYEGSPAAFLQCGRTSGAKGNESPELGRLRCERQVKEEASAVEAKLRDTACASSRYSYGGELIRYSPADPGPFGPWAYEYSVGSQVKPFVRLAFAAATGGFLLLLLGRLVVTESHMGWRRASVVGAALIALCVTVYLFLEDGSVSEQDAIELLVSGVGIFLASLMALLVALRVQRWVAQGFTAGKDTKAGLQVPASLPSASEPVREDAPEPATPSPEPNARLGRVARRPSDGSPALTIMGFVLLCVAFAAPVIGVAFGAGNSVDLSRSIPQQLGSLLVIGGISFFITRNRSERARSRGTLVVGALMCLFAFVNLREEVRQATETKEFFQKALTYQQERKASFAEFKQRFEQFNLASILTPESMSQAGARVEARAQLAQYTALLAERKALLETHFKQAERFISGNAPEFAKTTALQALKGSEGEDVAKVYDSLHKTQSAMADGMAEVLNWAERNQGKVQFEARQARFASPGLQAEFNALVGKLKELETAEQTAVREAEALQSKAEVIMERNTAVMESLAK